MKISSLVLLFIFVGLFTSCINNTKTAVDYKYYHAEIISAERLISQEKYTEAIKVYERVIDGYDFVFLRDYQVVSQLCLLTGDKAKGLHYIKKGITDGWKLEALKEQSFLSTHLTSSEWKEVNEQYPDLHKQFLGRIDSAARDKMLAMFKKDQQMAGAAAMIEDDNKQEAFILANFPKHSEKQLQELLEIINSGTYPGEFSIGNDFWGSTILSHHNSIAPEYVKKDTLYGHIRSKLFHALKKGHISPYEIALMEDWKSAVTSEWAESPFGYLNPPNTGTISKVNKSREMLGLRSVELRNALIDIEQKTGMNFYLPDWVEGKIEIEPK